MDTIYVNNLELFATHGVYKKEHDAPQRFKVSVRVCVAPPLRRHDQIGGTLDYRFLRQAVLQVMHGPHVQLIEVLAEHIAALLFTDKRVLSCEVEIQKLDLWTNGQPGVRIQRVRAE
ncbi:MAG: dihydroneopterin aldolase [Candidatus Andersenbacteria bacterium]